MKPIYAQTIAKCARGAAQEFSDLTEWAAAGVMLRVAKIAESGDTAGIINFAKKAKAECCNSGNEHLADYIITLIKNAEGREMSRPLGKTQRGILGSLVRHKRWHTGQWGCGWIWSTRGKTIKLLDTLVKRGLARIEQEPVHGYSIYHPTEAGIEAANNEK